MLKSALFIFFITTFLAYAQSPATAVFYNGNVYTLSVSPIDITVDKINTSLATLSVRKKGDINYVALYIIDSSGVENPLYIKENGRNVYLTTSKIQRTAKLGESFSFILPSHIYTFENGVERRVSIDNLNRIVVRAFYNNNVYLDNALDIDIKLTEYLSPKIEILNVFLSESSKNVYAITLKYSGGQDKNVSFYYREGYESRVYNLIEPLVGYGQTDATSIILKNTFNDGIGKEYIVQAYFKAESTDKHLFFNAFDENGETSTIALQVILDAVDNAPVVIAAVADEADVAVLEVAQKATIEATVTQAPRVSPKQETPTTNTLDYEFSVEKIEEIEKIEKNIDEPKAIENNDSFEKQYLTRQNFIDFPKHIISSIAENSGNSLDIVFVIDVTGSMKMALDSVKKYVDEIIVQMHSNYKHVRVGFVQFRDVYDDFLVKSSGYMTDRYEIKRLVYSLNADGGGDLAEPILDAIDCALTDFKFEAEHRQMFVITDAPNKPSIYTTEKSVMDRIRARNIDLKYFVLPVMK